MIKQTNRCTFKYLLLTIGFEKPTREIMEAWGEWFDSIQDKMVEQGGFSQGKEVTPNGTKDLPFDLDAITGYVIINAESLGQAEKVAKDCPMITSTKVFEIMPMKS